MNTHETHPQPDREWIATEILNTGKRLFYTRTLLRDRPLCKFRVRELGGQVYVELLPSLALCVRDHETGEVLAQSAPGDFNTADMTAPKAAQLFRDWQAARTSAAGVAPINPNPPTTP